MQTFSFVSVEKQRFTDHASENTLYTLFQNGRHFVSMQIGPYGLAFKRKIQKKI